MCISSCGHCIAGSDFLTQKITATNVIITDFSEGKQHTFCLVGVFPLLQTLSHLVLVGCNKFSDTTLSQLLTINSGAALGEWIIL